jgi:YcxB-like protein
MHKITVQLTLNDYALCSDYVSEKLRRQVPYYWVSYALQLLVGMLVSFGFFALFAVGSRLKGSNGTFVLLSTSCVVGAVCLYFLTRFFGQRAVALQLFTAGSKYLEPAEVSPEPSGIVIDTINEHTVLKWSAIERFEVNGPHLYLFMLPNNAVTIPESSFKTRAEFEAYVGELHALWHQHR